jgi:aspartate/methionine/tyrosine aminotransferase
LAAENGIAVHPEREVLITCGEQEALFVALHVLLEPGDEAILTAPARAADVDVVEMARATPRALAADPERGLGLDPDAVARAVTGRTKAIVLRAPGLTAPGEAELEALAGIVGEHELTVIAVESLEPLLHDGAVHRSFAALPGMAERTVTINGFSAVWGLEAWRVAYLAGPQALVGPMIALKQALSICSPAVSQYAALAAVLGPQDRVREARAEVRARREALLAALDEGGARCVAPAAGWHVLVEGGAQAAQAAGVRAATGTTVGLPGWLRLSLTEPPERLELAGRRLAAALTAPDLKETR